MQSEVAAEVAEERPTPSRRIFRNSLTILTATLLIQVLGVATGIITARTLGPDGKGQLTAAILWPSLLATFGGLGLSESVAYFTSRSRGREGSVVAAALLIVACQSVVLPLIGLAIIPLVLSHYGAEAVVAGMLYLAWIPLTLCMLAILGSLQGRLDFLAFGILRVTVVSTTAIGLVALYLTSRVSLESVVIVYLVANILTLLGAFSLLVKHRLLNQRPNVRLIWPMLAYSVKAHTGNIASVANERADQVLISIFLAPSLLGYYAIAVTLTGAVSTLGPTLAQVALPTIAHANSAEQMRRDLGLFTRVTFVSSALVAGGMVIVAPLLIGFLFGPAYLPAVTSTMILLVATVSLSTSRVLSAGLKACNQPLAAGLGEIVALGVTVVALGVLLPWLGLIGAAISSLLAYSVNLCYVALMCRRYLNVTFGDLFVPNRSDVTFLQTQVLGRIPFLTRPGQAT